MQTRIYVRLNIYCEIIYMHADYISTNIIDLAKLRVMFTGD